jgi:2-oxoglutarate ferredoxin oxidoreductase subunit beta
VRMHDGSVIKFRRVDEKYDPTDRDNAYAYLREHQKKGEVVTGLLHVNEASQDLHDVNKTVPSPLVNVPYEQLTPGAAALAKLQKRYR